MNMQEKLEILKSYIDLNIAPILIEDIDINILNPYAVRIPASISITELNGHFENKIFLPPKWFNELEAKSKNSACILIIDNLSSLPIKEQIKFVDILKYKKTGTINLPQNCVIIITGEKGIISEEINSLVVSI